MHFIAIFSLNVCCVMSFICLHALALCLIEQPVCASFDKCGRASFNIIITDSAAQIWLLAVSARRAFHSAHCRAQCHSLISTGACFSPSTANLHSQKSEQAAAFLLLSRDFHAKALFCCEVFITDDDAHRVRERKMWKISVPQLHVGGVAK